MFSPHCTVLFTKVRVEQSAKSHDGVLRMCVQWDQEAYCSSSSPTSPTLHRAYAAPQVATVVDRRRFFFLHLLSPDPVVSECSQRRVGRNASFFISFQD